MIKKTSFIINSNILLYTQNIYRELGYLSGAKLNITPIALRKNNKIKTIQSSLAIEGNNLNIEQITAILEGKKVLGPRKDIIEAQNAIEVYNLLRKLNPLIIKDFLSTHKIMMNNLISDNGQWRKKQVGILKENKVTYIVPQAKMVPSLINDLFHFINYNNSISWIIKACIFHYELEFIHPFSDGNGRMGRLWQQLLLMKEDGIFEYMPIELLIKNNQETYYQVLTKCDKERSSTLFIEFMLEHILFALKDYSDNTLTEVNTAFSRLLFAQEKFKIKWFSRKEYMLLHKNISTATASRDLKLGLEKGILSYLGSRNQTLYKFLI